MHAMLHGSGSPHCEPQPWLGPLIPWSRAPPALPPPTSSVHAARCCRHSQALSSPCRHHNCGECAGWVPKHGIAWLCYSMPSFEFRLARPTPSQHPAPPQPAPEAFDLAARAVVLSRVWEAAYGSALVVHPLHSLLWNAATGALRGACWDTAKSTQFGAWLSMPRAPASQPTVIRICNPQEVRGMKVGAIGLGELWVCCNVG